MAAGETLRFKFTLVVTPVRPINWTKHWSLRWAQLGGPANYSFLASRGATVVNMHQGNEINPWINYPYLTNELMKEAADACHALGMRFDIYNTMRELSDRCNESFAMFSFDETFVPGSGGGNDYLQEHFRSDYLPAWSNPLPDGSVDAAIRVKALSRWNNYYVAGIAQMMRDFGMDGLYLDEIAFDRVTILRARNMLGVDGLIDHHSDSGAFCVSPAMNYMELFPFIDKLWYGEGFNYDAATADYWLVEMSGLMFGLTADMLRYQGMTPYHFRGMLVGSSNRWQDTFDGTYGPFVPTALWALWDTIAIHEAQMFGWWLEIENGGAHALPVRSNNSDVKVTTYVRAGVLALVVLASFAETPCAVVLDYDWTALGFPASQARLQAPALPAFQPTAVPDMPLDGPLAVPVEQGWMLLLTNINHQQ